MKQLVIILFLAMSVTAHCQLIDSVKFSPATPNPGDTITVLCYVGYPNIGCPQTSINWYFGPNYNIFGRAFHCGGMVNMVCYTTDTFKVVVPAGYPGYYNFHYMPGFDMSVGCTFPIMWNGDTIPYPYAMATVQIPVGVPPNGIQSLEVGKSISLFPNPTNSDQVTIFLADKLRDYSISIFDLQGRLVSFRQFSDSSSNSCTVNVADLNPGMYVLSVEGEGRRFIERLVIVD